MFLPPSKVEDLRLKFYICISCIFLAPRLNLIKASFRTANSIDVLEGWVFERRPPFGNGWDLIRRPQFTYGSRGLRTAPVCQLRVTGFVVRKRVVWVKLLDSQAPHGNFTGRLIIWFEPFMPDEQLLDSSLSNPHRLLQMLVGSGCFVVGFAVPTKRLRCVMYWYIAENDRWQRDTTIVWNRCSH